MAKAWFTTLSFVLWLIAEHRITPDKIDDIIRAEIPNPTVDPGLHQILMSNMVHGPCETSIPLHAGWPL